MSAPRTSNARDGAPPRSSEGWHHVEHVMGMAVSFDGRDVAVDDAGLLAAVAWLHHVEATFSTYRDDSDITRLARGEVGLDDVDGEVRTILHLCERLRVETDGAFDAFAVPAPNGTTLDPSGVVKGWAVERAADLLGEHGHVDFTINAGGDVAVRGRPAPGERWRIGIRHPTIDDRLAAVLALSGPAGVATSATYERGAHIVDPHDGQPSVGPASVTVVGRDLALADAYATAAFVMGDDAAAWLEQLPGHEGLVITHDDVVLTTSGLGDVLVDPA